MCRIFRAATTKIDIANKITMSNLSKETQQAIANRASEYADQQHANDGDDIHIGYLEGATEWAGRAQGLVDALKEAKKKLNILHNSDAIEIITAALAKYKEVGNG
jgi:hypothetical protein